MPQFLFRSLLFSLLLHGLLLALLRCFFLKPSAPAWHALYVDLPPDSGGASKQAGLPAAARTTPKPKKAGSTLSSSFGGLRLKPRPFAWEEGGTAGVADQAASGEGAAGGFLQGRDVRWRLFRLVEEGLPYPADLFAAGRSGKVLFRLRVDAGGRIRNLHSLGGERDLEAWFRSRVGSILARAWLPPGKGDETFDLEFHVNDSVPDAAGPIRGNRISFYRSNFQELAPVALFQTEASKADPLFYRNREPKVEVRFDPARVFEAIFHPGRKKRHAEERLTLERELLEARDKRHRQSEARD